MQLYIKRKRLFGNHVGKNLLTKKDGTVAICLFPFAPSPRHLRLVFHQQESAARMRRNHEKKNIGTGHH